MAEIGKVISIKQSWSTRQEKRYRIQPESDAEL